MSNIFEYTLESIQEYSKKGEDYDNGLIDNEDILNDKKEKIQKLFSDLMLEQDPQLCLKDCTRYNPLHLNTTLIKEKLTNNFYNPNVMIFMKHLFEFLINMKQPNEKINYFFRHILPIGKESVNGVAMSVSLKDEMDVFVLKIPKNSDDNEVNRHELAVGIYGTNSLREFVPNFSYLYGGFVNSAPSIDIRNHFSWNNSNDKQDKQFQYIVYENINESITFYEYIETCSLDQFFNNYLQIILALNIANKKIDFTHYDLHGNNVLIRNLNSTKNIQYSVFDEKFYLKVDTVATIIDYGSSFFRYKGIGYGSPVSVLMNKYFIFDYRSNPYHDVYNLLRSCAIYAIRIERFDILELCKKMFLFFHKKENIDNILRVNDYVFLYPVENNTNRFINFLLTNICNPLLKNKSEDVISPTTELTDSYDQNSLLEELTVSKPEHLNDIVFEYQNFNIPFPSLTPEEIHEYINKAFLYLKDNIDDNKTLVNLTKIDSDNFGNNIEFEDIFYKYKSFIDSKEYIHLSLNSLKFFIDHIRKQLTNHEYSKYFEECQKMRDEIFELEKVFMEKKSLLMLWYNKLDKSKEYDKLNDKDKEKFHTLLEEAYKILR